MATRCDGDGACRKLLDRAEWIALLLILIPAGSANAADNAKITGSATYRERVALSPDAVFEATLEDVSRADAPVEIIARTRTEGPGQVPIRFEIAYDRARIQPRGKYVVRATISDGGQLRFTTTRAYPVLASSDPDTVAILMSAVSGNKAAAKPKAPAPSKPPSSGAAFGGLPATFTGLLPCSDCTGIRYQVNLLPGRGYMQRTTYLRSGGDQSVYDIGIWSRSEDSGILTLDDGERPSYWEVKDAATLRKLGAHDDPIRSDLSYELARSAAVEPMQPRLKLRGMFLYMADAARFRDCRSGLEWPVEMSADYKHLERVYTAERTEPGAELMVSVQGRVEQRPKMEGSGAQPTLIVEEFIESFPGRKCAETAVQAGLENTRWRPVQIGGEDVVVAGQQREPWIVLDPRTKRFTGSGGCNRISGSYEAGYDSLRFTQAVSTMMSCPTLDTEKKFLEALNATRSYRAQGRMLELLGEDGRVLARLEERNLR